MFPNLHLCLWYSTQLYMMFLTAEFASTIRYPELRISFGAIRHPLWPASLWWCFISKSVIFPIFGNKIRGLHELFKNDFSNLPPTWIASSPSKNESKREVLLLLFSYLFKSLEFFKDFKYRSSTLTFCYCAIFINFVFATCVKCHLVLNRAKLFTFLMITDVEK